MNTIASTSKVLLTVIALILALGIGNFAWAKEFVIQNDLNVDLYFTEVLNRQNFKIKSRPPEIVKKGSTGSFNASYGNAYYKNVHLKVEYAVGWSGSTDRVNFGLKQKADQNSFHCFTHKSTDAIAGKVNGCNHSITTFRFYYADQ